MNSAGDYSAPLSAGLLAFVDGMPGGLDSSLQLPSGLVRSRRRAWPKTAAHSACRASRRCRTAARPSATAWRAVRCAAAYRTPPRQNSLARTHALARPRPRCTLAAALLTLRVLGRSWRDGRRGIRGWGRASGGSSALGRHDGATRGQQRRLRRQQQRDGAPDGGDGHAAGRGGGRRGRRKRRRRQFNPVRPLRVSRVPCAPSLTRAPPTPARGPVSSGCGVRRRWTNPTAAAARCWPLAGSRTQSTAGRPTAAGAATR